MACRLSKLDSIWARCSSSMSARNKHMPGTNQHDVNCDAGEEPLGCRLRRTIVVSCIFIAESIIVELVSQIELLHKSMAAHGGQCHSR